MGATSTAGREHWVEDDDIRDRHRASQVAVDLMSLDGPRMRIVHASGSCISVGNLKVAEMNR